MRYRAPSPRPSVANDALTRPDWTQGSPRDARLAWLDKNENADLELAALAARVVAEVVARDPKALSTYPENGPLYRKLAKHVGVGPENLTLTAGSDGAIRAVYEAYVSPGDRVVHTAPSFAMYSVYSLMYGAEVHPLEYTPGPRGPELGVETVCAGISKARPKVVCLPNPDSPTGTVFSLEELRRIVETAGEVGALILIDEAYHPFHEPTVVPWVRDYEHLVVARTFAKAWGLAGLRIGYAVAAPQVVRFLHKVRPMYEVNTLAVAVMERMLDHEDEVRAAVRRLNDGRDHFLAAMERLGFRTVHAKGNFLHVAFGELAPKVHAALKDVVLYRQDHKDACLRGFTRFSATTDAGFASILERIERVVMQERIAHAK